MPTIDKFELNRLLEEGLSAEESGLLCPFSDVISNIRKELELMYKIRAVSAYFRLFI